MQLNLELNKKVYEYIDFELKHFEESKKLLDIMEIDIIEEKASSDGQPRGNTTGDPTQQKALKLISNVALARIQYTVDAIKRVYENLTEEYKDFFDWCFTKDAGKVKTCEKVHIAPRTYNRWKDKIIYATAKELGLL